MSLSTLGLPPIPPELKGMSPYLQRAEELKARDPIMSYWCAYYAAQVGIGLKVKEPSARNVLFDLLGLLENMKEEIGPNDAIDEESVSSAFVENFALKVFSSADNEDRRGEATRATAKKFLAAANFLEILSIFEFAGSESGSSNIEKIRYSKWKAADIAKAYREGRKPTPGPAGDVEMDSNPPVSTITDVERKLANAEANPASPSLHSRSPSNPATHPPAIARTTPPPPQLGNLPPSPFTQTSPVPPTSYGHLLPDGFVDPQTAVTPGAWSTAATPGSPAIFRFDDEVLETTSTKATWLSEELEGRENDVIQTPGFVDAPEPSPIRSADSTKQVRFTPPVANGSLTTQSFEKNNGDEPFTISIGVDPPRSPQESLTFLSAPSSHSEHDSLVLPSAFPLPPPPGPPHTTQPSTPLPTINSQIPQAYSQASKRPIPSGSPLGAATIIQAAPVELTPKVITQIQKRCKFAISALDYEDAPQARKELREALRMLGG